MTKVGHKFSINKFNKCKRCGECCKIPCDIIPDDLPPLLDRFKMDLQDFFKKYLIALLVTALPEKLDLILVMVPVSIDSVGNRDARYLADKEYLDSVDSKQRHCIFLKDNNCSIYNIKPYGGCFLNCLRMTGSKSIQLSKSQYFPYWARNQQLFDIVFPGFNNIFNELSGIAKKIRQFRKENNNEEITKLAHYRKEVMVTKLFLLFNKKQPNDFKVLC